MKEIIAEIIAIGDEILFGQITNTNVQFISSQLDTIGISTISQVAVSDLGSEITKALDYALLRADIVLITGGLGPTKDDLTKYTLANYFDSELEINNEALAHITNLVESRGRQMNELNRLQALQPVKATYIKNEVGTAPAMWFQTTEGKVVIAMPGVPFEMKYLMENSLIPKIKETFTSKPIVHYYVKTIGIAESTLAIKIEDWENSLPSNVKLAYLPSYGQVRLRLTSVADESQEVTYSLLEAKVKEILPTIGKYIYHLGTDIEFEQIIAQRLITNNLTLGLAESCTGGALASLFTAMAGSSQYFIGGTIPYHPSLKVSFLGVNQSTLDTYGVVSEETAIEMASGAAKNMNANIGIATTGVAGPTTGEYGKGVGTVCIGLWINGNTYAQTFNLMNVRETNIRLACIMALNMLRIKMDELKLV